MKHVKTLPATYSVKSEGEEGWEIEGEASVFGTSPDAYGDVVFKGAFSKTIKERLPAGKVRFFYDHIQPLGVFTEIWEDEKALKVRGKISKTALGHDVRTLLMDGAIGDLSIGYDLPGDKNEPNEHGGINIREARLYEVSLVGIGAQEEAVVTGVKSLREEQAELKREIIALKSAIPDSEANALTKASGGEVQKGTFVSWDSSGGSAETDKPPVGKVVSIHTDGPVPDIDAEVVGTEDEPAAKVQVYTYKDDESEEWEATDTYVGHKVSSLTPIDPPEGAGDSESSDSESSEKAASGSTDLPLANSSMSWDGDAAKQALAKWAEGEDGEIKWSDYGKGFFWHADSPEKQGDFKLPFAQPVDGELKAVPAGVKAAANVIQGGQGGADIPESDIASVKSKIASYYKKMDEQPPWEEGDKNYYPTIEEIKAARTILALAGGSAPETKSTRSEDEPPSDEDLMAELRAMQTL